MTHLLLQTDKLEILSNEREFPVKEKIAISFSYDDIDYIYDNQLETWRHTATRVTVHPGEVGNFEQFVFATNDNLCFSEQLEPALKQGIIIPECFEIHTFWSGPTFDARTHENKLAFFRSEEKATDPNGWIKILNRLPDTDRSVLTWNQLPGSTGGWYKVECNNASGFLKYAKLWIDILPLPEAPKQND